MGSLPALGPALNLASPQGEVCRQQPGHTGHSLLTCARSRDRPLLATPQGESKVDLSWGCSEEKSRASYFSVQIHYGSEGSNHLFLS